MDSLPAAKMTTLRGKAEAAAGVELFDVMRS
jgi:hypothetical protein